METSERTPSWGARLYIAAVCLLGVFVLFQARDVSTQDYLGLIAFLLLGGVTELFPIRFDKNASVSMTMAVALAAALTFGPAVAVWVNFASGFVHYWTKVYARNRPFYVSAVTTSTLMIAAAVAGQLYLLFGGIVRLANPDWRSLVALVIAGSGYYVVNSALITGAIALEKRSSFLELLRPNYQWLTVNIASLTPLGFGLSFIYLRVGITGLVLFLLPTTIAWYSFRLYAKTTDDIRRANDELKEANARVRESNAELTEANARVQRANEELKVANERLNVMYEVSRALAGSLRLEETLGRIVTATKIMGFEAGFVTGPAGERSARTLHWHANHPAYAQWATKGADRAEESALRKAVDLIRSEDWYIAGQVRALPSKELGLEAGQLDPSLAGITLVPLSIRGQAQWLVGVSTSSRPSPLDYKELFIFRSMAENALEMALAHERAQRDALSDAGTGLYNHRYFQEALQRELEDAAQLEHPLSFLMLDIDKLKQVNDLYGHLVGDQVLKIVAQIIRACIRETDTACRYGGDEMCILLPDAGRARAVEVASRIDQAIRAYPFRARRENDDGGGQLEEVKLSVSIGVSTYPDSSHTRAGLVAEADRACYRAKAAGGGVVAACELPVLVGDSCTSG